MFSVIVLVERKSAECSIFKLQGMCFLFTWSCPARMMNLHVIQIGVHSILNASVTRVFLSIHNTRL